MNFILSNILILAQEGGAPAGPPAQPSGGLLGSPMIMVILMMVMMYFVLIRPQRKQQKALEEMRGKLGVGDKVVTAGGIHGIVTGQSKTTVSVKVADGLSIKFDRGSIQHVLSSKNQDSGSDDAADDEENAEDAGK